MQNAETVQSSGFEAVPETIQKLRTSRATLYGVFIRQGYLHPIKVGRRTLFASDEVDALAEKMKSGEVRIPARNA